MSFRMNELSNDSFDFEELYSAVFENEISNSDSIALKLILDVDGIAFGYNQFNTKYNSYGYEILRKVGASETEIRDIKVFNSSTIQSDQTFNNTTWSEWKVKYSTTYNSVNNKLKLNKNILLEDAQSFLKNNFLRIKSYLSSENVLFENPSLMMAMFVDYDNQLYFQKNGQIHTWIRTYSNTNNPITLAAYIEWRMDTNWGKINPTNVIQRINVMNKRTYLLEGTVEKTVEVIERKNYTDYFTRINKHLFKVSNSSYSLRNGIGKLKTGSNSERTFKDLYYSSTFYQDTAKEEYLIIIENSITKIIKMLDPNFDQNRDHDMFLRTIGKFQDYQIVPLLSTFNMLVHAYNFVEVALSNEVGEDSYLITKGIIEKIIKYCDMILVEDITATYLNLLDSLIDEYKILDENISNPLNTELSLVNYIGCEFTSDYTNLKKVRDMSNKEFIESFLTFNVITNHINSNQSYAQLTQDITEETESTELINRPASFLIFNLYFKTTSKLYFSEHFYIKDSLDYSYSKFINYNSMKFLSEMNKIRLANFDATANTSVSVEDQIALELDNVDALTPNDSRLQTFAKIMDKQREQQEEYKPSINNLTMSGDEEVQELIQKQADLVVQLNKAITTVEKIKDKETAMKGYKRTFSSSNIVEGFKVYFDYLRTSQEVHADNLDTILSLSEANEKSEALVKSPDFCFMIMLGIYSIYASTTGDAISFDDYNSEAAYDRHKNSLSGIQSLPGWIDINQIRHEEWNPQLEALKDSDFWKYYANFYTFSESKTNPFNSLFINDPGFLQQQEYALKGKERLITDRDVLEEKLNNLFYGANELFGNHSLWTFTNLLADLFAELESPFTADILVGGVGDSFMNFFKNISVEITSTLLLEILAKLLEVDFIDIGGQKRSLLDIYNDLLMIQKIFSTMSQMDEEDGLEHSKEMDDLKTTLLSTDNVIGKLLDSKFYFALDGTNQYSTELETFLNSVDYEGLNIDSFFDMLYKNDEGDQWNLFSQNLSAWYMYKVASSFKTYQNPNNIFNSKETSNLYTLVRNSTDIEKQYAFFCAIQPLTGMVQENYFLKLIEDGQFLNGIVTQEEIFLLCEYLPTDQNNAGFNYVENCERLYEDYPQIFIFSGQPDYEYFFSTVDSSMSDFNTAITTNVDVITGILLNQENGILVDTIARLLPTTYLFKNIGRLPIDQWIEKLIGYFDEWILSGLDLITTSLGFEKKRSVAIYERETRYILKTNYERKIRLFSTMIDIVYNDALSMSICLGLTDVTDINVAYEILKNIREEFKKYSPAEQSSSSDLGKDFESNSSSSDNTNQGIDLDTPSNDENLQDIVDQIKDGLVDKEIIISGVTDGSLGNINNPIAIVPSGTGSSSSEEIFEDGFDYITSDEDLLDHIVSGSTRPIVITGGDLGGSLDDFFTPSEDQLIESAKEQIVAGIVKDTLDEIIKSITDTGQDFKQADIVGDIEDANNFVSHDESGKLISVDFSKVSPDKFLNSIVNFDFQDFVNFKYTTLKMFGNNE